MSPPPMKLTANLPPPPAPGDLASELAGPVSKMMHPQPIDIVIFMLYFGIGSIGAFFSALTVVTVRKMSEAQS